MKWLHYLFIVSLLLFSCKGQNVKNKRPTRLLTDALQREVALPDTIRQLVCIRSSAIRLVTYAGGAPLICGVEEQETRPNEFTHIFAIPIWPGYRSSVRVWGEIQNSLWQPDRM